MPDNLFQTIDMIHLKVKSASGLPEMRTNERSRVLRCLQCHLYYFQIKLCITTHVR